MQFAIQMEIVALIIFMILFMYHMDRQNSNNTRYHLFTASLILAVSMTLFDIASTAALQVADAMPDWVHMFMNTMYFVTLDLTFSVMAIYCFYTMFEYAVDRHCFRVASTIIIAFACVLMAINVLNIWNGWIFTFEDGVYQRGPYNKIGFIPLIIESGMLCMCYYRNRHVVGRTMRRLVQSLVPLVLVLLWAQIMVPDVILSGMLAALASMVLFINFQSNRNGRDPMTGLLNRVSFIQSLRFRGKREKKLHLIMIHLEQFEEINKKFGIKMGDTIIVSIGHYLEKEFPKYQICRFGNTTFALLAASQGEFADAHCADKLLKRFQRPWIDGKNETLVRVSIAHRGVEFDGYDENTAIDQLEYALAFVRESGGNDIVCFDRDMAERYRRQEYVLGRVKQAIEEHAFEMHYQPIYGCRDKCVVTAESLIRLREPDGSFISPAEFIPLAEKQGLLEDISKQVLDMVCEFLAAHRDLPINQFSINLAVGQILDPSFVELICERKRFYNIPDDKLRIEITERTMAEETALVHAVMEQLEKEGIRFYLDDFGVGYSNIAMMLGLPFETIKLDASLISNLSSGSRGYHTVRLLVEMLHNSGFQVVAEGIETEEQMRAVQSLSIDKVQGYYFARPMPGDDLVCFLGEYPKKE